MVRERKGKKITPYYMQPEPECHTTPVAPVVECPVSPVDPVEECPPKKPMVDYIIECPEEEEVKVCPEEEVEGIHECCFTDPVLDYLREVLAGELEGINYYQELILKIPDCKVQEILCEIMNDEKFHVASHLYLLAKYDHVQNEEFEAVGWEEAGEDEYYRHGSINPNNPAQMMPHLMQHFSERIQECMAEYLDKCLEEEVLERIYGNLPPHIKDYLENHLDEEDLLCYMPPQIKQELIQCIICQLPQNLLGQLTQYIMDCASKHAQAVVHQHTGGPAGGPIIGQMIHYCQANIPEFILCYLLDYFLDYLEEEAAEEEAEKEAPKYHYIPNDCKYPVEEEVELECPKGESDSKVCDVCPPWLVLIRRAIVDELKAINQYRDYITRIPYPDIQESLCAAMNTEKEHVALLTKILRMCDYTQAEELAQFGWQMPHCIY